jgi:hypothetical protein
MIRAATRRQKDNAKCEMKNAKSVQVSFASADIYADLAVRPFCTLHFEICIRLVPPRCGFLFHGGRAAVDITSAGRKGRAFAHIGAAEPRRVKNGQESASRPRRGIE